MATILTTNLKMPEPDPVARDRDWGTRLNECLDAIDASVLGNCAVTLSEIPSTTLNVDVAPGAFINSSGAYIAYAGATAFACTTASTNYIWLTDGGTLTKGAAFPTATQHVRLAVVVAGATTITSITDARGMLQTAIS